MLKTKKRILYRLFTITFFNFVATSLLHTVYCQTFSEVDVDLIGVDVSQNRNAWGDFDNDGDLDLLLTGDFNDLQQSFSVTRIYRNENGNFEPVSTALLDVTLSAASWGDFDNDGDLDILLSGLGASGRLATVYRNENGDFIDNTAPLIGLTRVSVDWGDFDHDGDLDIAMIGLVSATEALSSVYRNENGTFVRMSDVLPNVFLGTISWVDYDNDADLDIFLMGLVSQNEITAIYNNESGVLSRLDFPFLAVSGGPAAWGDFDNDGDLDAIVTGAAGDIGLSSRIYENLGTTFQDREAGLTNLWGGAVAWGDVDNDGDLDIVMTGSLENNNFLSQVLRNDDGNFNLLPNEPLIPVTSTSSAVFGDYDNDGDLDLLLTGNASSDGTIPNTIGSVTRLYQNNSSKKNSPPNPPGQLVASVEDDRVFLQWGRAVDAETPQLGLSYNLRVGTNPGDINIMSPMADVASGHRKVVAIGNVFQNTEWMLQDLQPGIYYWSVQAIDHAFAGSPFAEEGTFTVSDHTSVETNPSVIIDFSLEQNYPNPFNPITTIVFNLPRQEVANLKIFNLAGQEMIQLVSGLQSAGKHEIHLNASFLTSGIYFYQLQTGNFRQRRKMILVR